MKNELPSPLRMTAATLVLTGLVYPLLVTAVAQVALPAARERQPGRRKAGGWSAPSSSARRFRSPAYFQPRPSAAGADGYDAAASAGSNLGPDVAEAARPRRRRRRRACGPENPSAPGRCPSTSSPPPRAASTPTLSPAAALWQVPRVAAARGVPSGPRAGPGRARGPSPGSSACWASRGQRAAAEPRPRPALPRGVHGSRLAHAEHERRAARPRRAPAARAGEEAAGGPRPPEGVLRRVARRGQDLRHARGGARAARPQGIDVVIGWVETHGRARDRGTRSRASSGSRRGEVEYRGTRARASSTSTRRSLAARRCCSSTSSRTPTRRARATRSAGRTRSSCSRRASTSTPR